MIELFNAITARWISEMGGRTLYNTEADSEAGFPYTVVSIVGNAPSWTFEEDFETVLVQFSIFSATGTNTEVLTVFKALKAAFDKHDLVVAAHETVSLIRGNANLVRVEKKWHLIVTYSIELQKD